MKQIRIDFDKIQQIMADSRWSSRQLAFASGLSGGAVDKWLSGASTPSAVNLKKICDVLKIDIGDVFVEEVFERVAA